MKNKTIKYDLIQNAKESLSHAIEHLISDSEPRPSDIKRAILDVTHVVELILKERLRRVHPAFIFENIDKYPSAEGITVSTEKALLRLCAVADVKIEKDALETIKDCRRWRNQIEHHEFEIPIKTAKIIIGRMLSFIFTFAKNNLELNLEEEFKKDDTWRDLLDFYEFWQVHSKAVEREMQGKNINVCLCPSCSANTFDSRKGFCMACGHLDDLVTCDNCNQEYWRSEEEHLVGLMNDDNLGVFSAGSLCSTCFNQLRA